MDAFTSHVNVGFYYGAFLPDLEGILIGTGKRMRYVKITPDGEVNGHALKTLIDVSYQDLKRRLQER